MKYRFGIVTAAIGLLCGCVTAQKEAETSPEPVAREVVAAESHYQSKPAPPAPEERATPSPDSITSKPIDQPATPPVKTALAPIFDPTLLIGRNREETRLLLGEPGDIRTAEPATIWRFQNRLCRLEVFFYMDLGARELRALSYDVAVDGKKADKRQSSQCAGQIKAGNDGRERG